MKLLKTLITSLILVLPFGQLTRLPMMPPDIHLYIHDVMVIATSITWLVLFVQDKKRRWPPLIRPITLFSIAILISLTVNLPQLTQSQLLVAALYALRWIGYVAVYGAVYLVTTREKGFSHHVLMILTVSGILVALLGLVQYVLYPNLRNLMYLGWDPHQYRLFGMYFDAGFTGIMLVLTLIALIGQPRFPAQRWIMVVVYTALILTYARSAYAALLAVLIAYAFLSKSFKILGIGAVVLVVSIFMLPRPAGEGVRLERTATIVSRVNSYEQALTIIKDSPLFGVGFNAYRVAQEKNGYSIESGFYNNAGAGTDSSLLFVTATTGIVGLLAYLYLLVAMIRKSRFNQVVVLSIAALIIHSIFLNSLFYPWVMIWLWLILGVRHDAGNGRFVAGSILGNNLK